MIEPNDESPVARALRMIGDVGCDCGAGPQDRHDCLAGACEMAIKALAEAREEGERAYRAEIVAALGCHPARVLQEIARLREFVGGACVVGEVRQREERRACWDLAERCRAEREASLAACIEAGGAVESLRGKLSEAKRIRDAIAQRGPLWEPRAGAGGGD